MRKRVRSKGARGGEGTSSLAVHPFFVPVVLFAIILCVFGQVLRHDFINYDDDQYVYGNPNITSGLRLDGILWAFTHVHADNWHPLTTISHMLDCQLFGLQPWGHHLINILLHAGATFFLLFALWELTGAYWPSAFVAAIFAVHPLRVESVAWVSERKDVLSGLFFMLTLWSYARYVRDNRSKSARYVAAIVFFALGLLSKPTLVTLPFVLLLLDFWPLRRFAPQSSNRSSLATRSLGYLVREKLPFFLLSAGSCVATLLAQQKVTNRGLDLGVRVGNAAISYLAYIGQMIWPIGLSPVYPYRTDGSFVFQAVLAGLLLLVVTAVFFVWRAKYPFLLVGWLWFLGVLVPMIGIVQVGSQARADRYTYLSQIGLYIVVTWGCLELFSRWPQGRKALIAVALVSIGGLTVVSARQASHWQNSETLWSYTLAHTTDNALAESNLGSALMKKNLLDGAAVHLRRALDIQPNYAEAHNTLGYVLMKKGQLNDAVIHFQKALELKPELTNAEYNLTFARGYALAQEGKAAEAITAYEAALKMQPNDPLLRNNLAAALAALGKTGEAIEQLRQAVRINRDYEEGHANLATLLLQMGGREEAMFHFREALRLNPNDAEVQEELRESTPAMPTSAKLAFECGIRGNQSLLRWTHYALANYEGEERERRGDIS